MSERVAGEGDQQDLGVAAGQDPNALEPEPFVACHIVVDPRRPVGPVGSSGAVAAALAPRGIEHRLVLAGEHVDLGIGEVRQAAGVIDVEVRQHDVPHIGRVESAARTCETAVSPSSS